VRVLVIFFDVVDGDLLVELAHFEWHQVVNEVKLVRAAWIQPRLRKLRKSIHSEITHSSSRAPW
jgi:hypothetical protein